MYPNIFLVAVTAGAALAVLLALLVPNPTPFQLFVFRIIVALSAAGVAASIPGFLKFDSEVISAGGAIGVFVIVYMLNPATLIKPEPPRRRPSAFQQEQRRKSFILRFVTLILSVVVCGTISLTGLLLASNFGIIGLPTGVRHITCGYLSVSNIIPLLDCPLMINEIRQSSNTQNFTITLTSVEFLENGKMRWHFQFRNQSNQPQNLGFDYRDTYIYDEFGNHYPVIGFDTNPDANGSYSEEVPVGIRVNHWFEFPPPEDNSEVFNFVLVHNYFIPKFGGVEFATPIFVINFGEY